MLQSCLEVLYLGKSNKSGVEFRPFFLQQRKKWGNLFILPDSLFIYEVSLVVYYLKI